MGSDDQLIDRIRDETVAVDAEGFRVRVSLERFFQDERARVLVWAERARPAAWLLRRLRAALPLPPRALALLAGGCLLPPGEPLALLRPDDLLEVIMSPGERAPGAAGEGEGEGERATDADTSAEEGAAELAAVKRRALRLLDEVAEGAPAPRRRRRARRRRAAPSPSPAEGPSERWRADDAGAGVLRSATPPRAARLVPAAR